MAHLPKMREVCTTVAAAARNFHRVAMESPGGIAG
jgi:hypothetical protein